MVPFGLGFLLILAVNLRAPPARAAYTIKEKKAWVTAHNWVREAAHPEAAKMNFVIWSNRLEGLAQKAADRCDEEHSESAEFSGIGENIRGAGDPSPLNSVLSWYTEKPHYDHVNRKCVPPAGSDRKCGHYAQMVTDTVTEIGCAYTMCPKLSKNVIYCEYDIGQGFYEYGRRCSRCPPSTPLCLSDLCVSNAVAELANATLKDTCKVECKNCGERNATTGSCTCNCGTSGSGTFCETKNAGSTAKCPQCADSPCLNGGVEDTSVTTECKCKCKDGAVGDRCEITKTVFDSSVALTIGAANQHIVNYGSSDIYSVNPPVAKSIFISKIWSNLTQELSSAINKYCRVETNFATCCPSKTFSSEASSKQHITSADLKYSETSFANNAEGYLTFLIHAVSSGSALCPAAVTHVPQDVMLAAIKAENGTISSQLTSCCEGVLLKNIEKATQESAKGTTVSTGSISAENIEIKPLISSKKTQQLKAQAVLVIAMSCACALMLIRI